MRVQGRLLSGLSPNEAALLFGALLRALAMKQCGPLSFGGRWGCGWPLAQTPWAIIFFWNSAPPRPRPSDNFCCVLGLHGGRSALHVRTAAALAELFRVAGQVVKEPTRVSEHDRRAPELALELDPRASRGD